MSAGKSKFTEARVLWFNDDKGFGFAEDVSGKQIYVHYSSITSMPKERRTLKKDQKIEVQVVSELGELRATKVRGFVENEKR